MKKPYPCLWFDNQAEEAANFYISIFPNSKIDAIARYGETGPGEPGSVMTVEFELDGQKFMGLNGGPVFKPSEAVSFVVNCASQEEVDRMWTQLTANGGAPGRCGWCKDRFGVSWQIVPDAFVEIMKSSSPDQAQRVMQTMLTMTKFDIAALERARDAVSA